MNRTWSLGLIAGISIAISTGCNNNPVENKSIAKVEAAAPVANASSEAGVPYDFSETGSEVTWVGAKVTGKHDGKFGKFAGQIQLVGSDPTKSAVKVEVAASSLAADNEKLTGHLKSPDFFDVEKYPTIRFQSSKIEVGGERGATHTVTGNLELHGVTKSIRFPATIGVGGDNVTIKSEFGINRKDFGIVYPGKPDDLIKDEVLVRLNVVAKKR
jgi:polyisoprenoid-binding protein YceI